MSKKLKNKTWALLFIFALLSPPLFSGNDNDADEEWKTRLAYARVLSYAKKFDKSEIEYQKLLKEKPDSITVKVELAKIYFYEKKYEEANALIAQIPVDQFPEGEETILADIAVIEKDYPKAEAIYQKMLDLSPDKKEEILLKLAEVQSWEKKYDESLENYQTLLKMRPNDVYLRREYAMVLSWAGKNEEAAKELEATLKSEDK